MEDCLEVTAGERGSSLLDHLGRAHDLELVVRLEGFQDLREPVTGARDVDAKLLFAVLDLGHVSLLTR